MKGLLSNALYTSHYTSKKPVELFGMGEIPPYPAASLGKS